MIAIIDYDAGNIKSVVKAFEYLGYETIVTRDATILLEAEKVVLPGVGAFGDAMEKLHRYNLVHIIHEIIKKGTPFLGICLGLQLLFEHSEEAPEVEGLGVLEGEIIRIPQGKGLKIPHIGWNDLKTVDSSKLFRGIKNHAYVYFVHSYYLKAKNQGDVVSTCEYGVTIHAAVERGNVYACQFHPEKSGEIGMHILENFATM